jgi:hypothetical protein
MWEIVTMESFAVIIIGLVAGLLLRYSRQFPDNTAEVLNRYVIWIALPGLILNKVADLPLDRGIIYPMLVAWGALMVSALLVLILARLWQWSKPTLCVLLLLVPLGNTSFVGIPLIKALIGESAIGYAILYDQLGSFLALATYGALILSLFSATSGVRASLQFTQVLRRVLTFPPFVALVLALLARWLEITLPLQSIFATFGATLVPVVMVAVGFQWRFRLPSQETLPLLFGLMIKLVVMPLLVWQVLRLFELPNLMSQVLVLESGMAPMISAGAVLISEGQNPRLAAAMVGYGLLFGLVTVPLLHYWLF